MIPVSKAIKLIDRETQSLGSEKIALSAAVGRILAENIVADADLPPFDRSMMDGYAVVAADTKATPVTLRIVGESAAGHGWHKKLRSGEAVRIMTGAPVPSGADAVQKVELTHEADALVTITEAAKRGQNIVRRAAEIKRGKRIFAAGETVTENMIAVLASFGYARVTVGKRPRVAILGTGSEIVDVAKRPGRDQIRNSNSAMLDVLCRKFAAETTVVPIIKDDIAELKNAIRSAAKKVDILIVIGGVSVGKYDHTKAALTELGAEIFFDKVCLKPGKPAVFARLGKTLIFGLPGNPVSAAVTFHLFVRKAILKLQHATQTDLKRGVAVIAADAKAARDRDTYLPASLGTNSTGQLVAIPLRSQGSSDFVGFARADALIFLPKGSRRSSGECADIAFL
ncbi:MAG: gephyrin-like molybdotransferase Glp [Pyrinomonadaceae bacterium]